MPDIVIRATEPLVFCIPFIKLLLIIAVMVVGVAYLFRVRIARLWLKICTRAAGTVLILPLILALIMLFVMVSCESRPRVLVSPDSRHVAEYAYEAGFLGRDITSVRVRRKWSVFPDVAYQYAGPSDWEGTDVRWLTNEILLVQYKADGEDRFQQCNTKAAGVTIKCVALK